MAWSLCMIHSMSIRTGAFLGLWWLSLEQSINLQSINHSPQFLPPHSLISTGKDRISILSCDFSNFLSRKSHATKLNCGFSFLLLFYEAVLQCSAVVHAPAYAKIELWQQCGQQQQSSCWTLQWCTQDKNILAPNCCACQCFIIAKSLLIEATPLFQLNTSTSPGTCKYLNLAVHHSTIMACHSLFCHIK